MRGICEVCGEVFVTHTKTIQYTCSYKCRVERGKRIEYVGGYVDKSTKARFKCNICGGIFERTPVKMCEKNSVGQCPLCRLNEFRICPKCGSKHINKHRKGFCEECADESSKTYKLICSHCGKSFVSKNKQKQTCSYECMLEFGKRMRESCYEPQNKKCKNCGSEFTTKFKKTNEEFCSDKCRKRMGNRNKKLYDKNVRAVRVVSNGSVDKDITLEKLIARDEGMCYICSEKIDEEDYTVNADGHCVYGNMYPSVDHVIPIAKGGTHTWDNVKLAHRLCNSLKGDRTQ